MNKPPGYYRDERGREHYWDGQTRSYIPDNSFSRFMTDMNRVFFGVAGFFALIILVPVGLGLIFLLLWVLWSLLTSPVGLMVVLYISAIVFVVLKIRSYWNQQGGGKE